MLDLFKQLQETYNTKMKENVPAVTPDASVNKKEIEGEPKKDAALIKKIESPDVGKVADLTPVAKKSEPKSEQGK